ncbi:MAG: alpha/beta hydrolase [Desulfovibrio sp.]|nr:alpha/beta hydrolase [Desulfovibrio sp.]
MRYDTHYQEGQKVQFSKMQGVTLRGLIFQPPHFDMRKKYQAIIVVTPEGGVKEQCASLYAWHLASHGYVALTFDPSHQGESEGLPKYLEDPAARVEDIRCAVDYLVTLPYIDENNLGIVGLGAGACYAMQATLTDLRLRAAAGVSTWDIGESTRKGFPEIRHDTCFLRTMREVAEERTKRARGAMEVTYSTYCPASLEECTEQTPVILREACEYYCTPRGEYPTAVNKYLTVSKDKLAAFDPFVHLDLVSPRPVLFIVGDESDIIAYTYGAYSKAKRPKEIFTVPGATHIDLYDKPEHVAVVVEKLLQFYRQYL